MIISSQFITKNGLKVLLIKRPEKYTVGYSFLINAGSIYENKKNCGTSHFFEHLFFGGTKSFPTEEKLREKFQEIGFAAGARTLQDLIEVYGSFPKAETKKSLTILRDIVFNSVLNAKTIEKERGVILSEIKLRRDDNYSLIWDEAIKNRFKDGVSLSLPIGGTGESVGKLSSSEILRFYKKYCNPTNSIFVMGSSLDFEKAEKLIREIFEDIPAGQRIPLKKITNKDMSGQTTSVTPKNTEHIYLLISFPVELHIGIKKTWRSEFLASLLGEALNKKLRIQKGLVYNLGVYQQTISKKTGIFVIQTSFSLEDCEEILGMIFKAIKGFKKGTIDMKTLNRIRLTGNRTLPMTFDSLSGALNWVIGSFYYENKIYSPEEAIEARNLVTKKDLQSQALQIFDYKKMNVLALGPVTEKELRATIKKLT